MNGEQQTFYSDNDSVLRKILEESPATNTTFSTITDLASDDSHKHNRVKATKTSHKRKPRKDKDGKLYPVGPRDVARLLLKDEHQAHQMKRIFEQTAERLDIESKRAIEAERRAREAEDRMLQMLDTTRDAQRELLRERDLLQAYQSQVEAAKNEILKAQKELDTLAEEKYKVEQEAAQERSRYRQLHKEVEVKEALNRGRLEGFMDGRKEGWQLGKDYARGKVRVWRDAEYYSEGEESASIFSTTDAPDPPPLNGYRLGQTRSNAQGGQTQTGQAPVTMPVPDIRSDLPARNLPRTATPHGNRRAVSAMQSPKSRTSGRSHRRNSTITMPVPNPAPATGPGPSSLRQNTLSTEDDVSIKSPRVYSTKTPLRPPSVRAPSTRPDTASRGRTPVNQIPTPTSPQASQRSQPTQPAEFSQPSQSVPSFEQPQTNALPPIRPIPSPQPRSPSHSPINPLPGGFIPVLEEGRISLPPPHEVDPFPPSPSAPQNRLFDTAGHQHQSLQQPMPPTVNVTVNTYPARPQQPPDGNSFTFPVPDSDSDPPPPPAREFSIPVPDIAPIRQSPAQMNYSHFYPQHSPSRRSPRLERRSPRTPVANISDSPVGALNDEIDGLNLAAELFETDENGNVPGTIGYVPPRGSTWRPLSAIPEGGSTAAESPAPERIRSRNPSAASFRNQVPKFPQFSGSSMLNKPQPPIPPRSPSMMTHSPISPHSPLPNLELIDEHGILNDPREYAEFTDIPNNFVTPSRQQLAEHLRPAPDIEQIRDDVSIRTSSTRPSGRDRIRMPTVDVAYLEKQAVLYDNFGSGRPYPGFNSSESSGDLAPTPRASRTPATTTRRTPGVPQVTLMEPSPPNRPASRASSRRNSIASIRSLDPSSPNDGAVPFIPPSPSQFQIPTSQHDFRIVKNPPSIASQSRMSTAGRMPTYPPDRTPGASNYAFSTANPGFVANATPARMNQPFSVASTVRNLAGGTQGAPSVRATPARLPATMNSTTTTIRRLPASRGTGRTTTSELPRLSMNFDSTSNAPAGFVPQASPAMFDAPSAMPAATSQTEGMFMGRTPANPMGGLSNEQMSFPSPGFIPQPPATNPHTAGTFMGRTPAHHMEGLSNEHMSHPAPGFIPQPPVMSANTPNMGGMFMGRTPANAMGGLPNGTPASTNINISNAANFKTGSAREPVTQTTTKEPARLPTSRRPSISASSTGRMPARLPAFTGGESSQQAQPQQQFPGFSQFDFGFGGGGGGGGGPFGGGGGSSDPNAFKATPASVMRNMSNVRAPARLPGHSSTNAPARLPDRNSTINTPARLPLPPSHVNTPWSMGGQLTNSRPPATLPTPGSRQQGYIPPSPHTSAALTPGRSGLGLPTGGSRAESHRGSPARSSSPYRPFDASTYVDPSAMHFPPSRPSSRAGSVRSAQGTTFRPASSYLLPPGGKVVDFRGVTIESASDEDD